MPSPGVTPNRRSIVSFDVETIDSIKQSDYWQDLQFEEISKGDDDSPPTVALLPGIGWQITSYNSLVSYLHEGTEADLGIVNLNPPSGFGTFDLFKRPDDLPGVPTGGLKASGDVFYDKNVASTTDFSDPAYRLASDQDAYEQPDSVNDAITMDRVGKSSTNHEPNQKITFRFFIPGLTGQAKSSLISIYFSGVAGSRSRESFLGIGQYCLKLYGDGQGRLFERGDDGHWHLRQTLAWTQKSQVCNYWHLVTIASDAVDTGSGYTGTVLKFQFQSITGLFGALVKLAIASLGGPEWQTYKIPREETTTTTPAPIRIDVRRDIRASFQVSRAIHFPTGNLQTITVGLPFYPSTDTPLQVEWYGNVPDGTSVDIKLYSAESVGEMAVADAGSSTDSAGFKQFTLTQDSRYYYAVLVLTSDVNQLFTPTINRVRFVRAAEFGNSYVTPFSPQFVERISITGQSSDPSHETAGLVVHDRFGDSTLLGRRAGMPMRIEIGIDPEDETKTTTLFHGYVSRAVERRRPRRPYMGFAGVNPDPAPKPALRTYSIQSMGPWQRLWELQLPKTYDFAADPSTGNDLPYKVTDIIRALLRSYYPATMVDVPDIDLRYFDPGKIGFKIEVFTHIGPIIMELARDYLGAYLVFDPNATNGGDAGNKYGCWRLKVPPRPPYQNLCHFVTNINFTGRSVVNINSYESDTEGDQEIKKVWIRQGSWNSWVVPPEGNVVYVQGAQPSDAPLAKSEGKGLLQALAINFDSFVYRDDQPEPDTNHPDWLGRFVPIFHSDPGLTSEAAVNFACRRIYDLAAHAQKRITFEAPLVLVTDASDTLQQRPRKLQFGDAVLVEGAQFIVDSCTVDYSALKGGDRVQMAVYEVFSVPTLSEYGGTGNLDQFISSGILSVVL